MAKEIVSIYKALADFQQEVKVIHKNTEGYKYTYADLASILAIINPLLKKHKLGFTQPLDGKALKTILFHTETEDIIEGSIDIPQNVSLSGMNDFQVLGSGITYLRRYSLAAMLGLITDDDNDAQGEQIRPNNNTINNTPSNTPNVTQSLPKTQIEVPDFDIIVDPEEKKKAIQLNKELKNCKTKEEMEKLTSRMLELSEEARQPLRIAYRNTTVLLNAKNAAAPEKPAKAPKAAKETK